MHCLANCVEAALLPPDWATHCGRHTTAQLATCRLADGSLQQLVPGRERLVQDDHERVQLMAELGVVEPGLAMHLLELAVQLLVPGQAVLCDDDAYDERR